MAAHRVIGWSGTLVVCALIAGGCASDAAQRSNATTPGSAASVDTAPGESAPGEEPVTSITVALTPAEVVTGPLPPAPPSVQYADDFTTDGDEIQGWWWLRDDAGAQSAQWVFGRMPGGGTIELQLQLLATNARSGGPGFPARFWLTYGPAGNTFGPAAEAPVSVELGNVALLEDPVGYTTRGTVVLDYDALPPNTTDVWVAINRRAPDGSVEPYHVAAQMESVVVTVEPDTDTDTDGTDGTDTTDGTTDEGTTDDGTVDDDTTDDETADGGTDEGFQGPPLIVSLGDSYISGEAGRWAGNPDTILTYGDADALGAGGYNDGGFGEYELVPGCHRSESAMIHIGQAEDGTEIDSLNIACSGGQTYTTSAKPGVDRCPDNEAILTDQNAADLTYWNKYLSNVHPISPDYGFNCPQGRTGQVYTLAGYAATREVKMVVLSIGGNNFRFADVVQECVMDFLNGRTEGIRWITIGWGVKIPVPYLIETHCKDSALAAEVFSPDNIAARRTEIANSIRDIRAVMADAGYTDEDWTLVVNTYPSPIPNSDEFDFWETGFNRYDEGCGFWDEDADWANAVALPTINQTVRNAVADVGATNIVVMDTSMAFNDRRLCEDDVEKVDALFGPDSWQESGAADNSEWVMEIHGILAIGGAGGWVNVPPFDAKESFHPNYWGQMALRNCVRQVYNNGDPIGGQCVRDGTGLNEYGEPNMQLI